MKHIKNHKGKIAAVLIILIVLTVAYFADRFPEKDEKIDSTSTEQVSVSSQTENNETIETDDDLVEEDAVNQSETNANQVVEGKPIPENMQIPETEDVPDEKTVCTLSVRCDTINQNIDLLDEGKRGLVPSDGIIYENQNAEFNEGESVFDVLLREMKNNKIHFEYVNTPMYNSVYLEGINNIYEFDCGSGSGWLYKVNGEFPSCGCSQYILKNNDIIEIVYTCNMGNDVGRN